VRDGIGKVDAVDDDVDCNNRAEQTSRSAIDRCRGTTSRPREDGPSSSSGKGPPLAVSAMSHLTMSSLRYDTSIHQLKHVKKSKEGTRRTP
jgi:hypothetical protein